jgi:type VI secretion system secreted protein VgrG
MLTALPPFFDHSRHTLVVHSLPVSLDVLAFEGEEQLSQPFLYRIEFTSFDRDIAADQILGKSAQFSLHAAPHTLPRAIRGLPVPKVEALRTLHGVISGFKRLSGSADEARYEVTLQPLLALLGRGKQYRIYQHQSVPEIVESVLRTRHDFEGQDFRFTLVRNYPRREQVMQYGESDLAFISRLLAEVGIWYRFTNDERLGLAVVEFHDDQRHYVKPRISLPYRPQSGLGSSGEDGVWQLQASHEVVEKSIHFRAYHPRDARAWLDGSVDQTRGDTTTYGEAYHYAEPYTALGDKLDQDEDLLGESGFFYGRLRHERYLNNQTRLSGVCSSASLGLAQVLDVSGGAPQAFEPGAVVTRLVLRAARDRSFELSFEAIPYSESLCFRPPLLGKPKMAGTVPARVTSSLANDPYSHIDSEGRYKVSFLFDRDTWKLGQESLWLRLARPYAGDTHGLHLPLICGTEVAIAFEQGDPDRPYIAHALHDSRHPDHVTLLRRDYTRNVLRTPANNKLRMEDDRGKERIKLSTEHSGKSQLNLGHLVDDEKLKRGEGFELRTDAQGAIRAGDGLFISADEQTKAQGKQLDMDAAVGRLQHAGEQLERLSADAALSQADSANVQAQLNLLTDKLKALQQSVLLLSAPQGIALTSGGHLQLAAQDNLTLNAGGAADISVVKKLFIGIGQGLSVFVRKLGIKLIANQGPVSIQAQNDRLELLARHGLNITSTEDEIHITAKKRIVLNAGGSYLAIEQCSIESGTAGDYLIKAAHFDFRPKATQAAILPVLPAGLEAPSDLHGLGPSLRGSNTHSEQSATVDTGPELEPEPLEEEEEEEEITEGLTEGITLRIGLFFDGTGNNQSNAAATEQCRRQDLNSFTAEELESIAAMCEQYGFGEFDGSGFNSAPDNSYGNAPSNVAHLYDLYPDNTATPLSEDAEIGYVRVYVEGIGTRSGGADATLIGQGLGQGETGVVARVRQTPDMLSKQLGFFQQKNPGITIRNLEFDLFGFSRGAAAARHCANEVLKPSRGLFSELLAGGSAGLLKHVNSVSDVCINLIGLFDTVAAISDPLHGDFSPGNDVDRGVNLYLPPDCARQVIQLHALDEYRADYSLKAVHSTHLQIGLPGAHSDIGGGYLPRAREKLWMIRPRKASVGEHQRIESHPMWLSADGQAKVLRELGAAREGTVVVKAWPAPTSPRGRAESVTQDYWITVTLERQVRGELALIALRVMRELGVRHGVPFKGLEERPGLELPDELKPINEQIMRQVMANEFVRLEPPQELLLRARYIHMSAHWTPKGPFLLSKPAALNRRNVHLNRPQEGYPA